MVLLVGDSGDRRKLLAAHEQIQQASMIPHRDVVAFVRYRHLHRRGIGWIDVHLLASAIVGQFQLWPADRKLSDVVKEIEISFE